jgi:TIGR00255 family protein
MTGYGRAELSKRGMTVSAEVRSVNSRYLEVTSRLPRILSHREKDVKEIVRSFLSRGSLNITVKIEKESNGETPLKVNTSAAKSYYKLLNELRKAVKLREKVKLEHLLNFSEILEPIDAEETDTKEWELVDETIREALKQLNTMRVNEGRELAKDFEKRIQWIDKTLDEIERLSVDRIPTERKRLQERIAQLLEDKSVVDQNRLELEIALLADKLDITEECVRYKTHNKFFLEAIKTEETPGRKLNFLIQEMNREANTIGSKANEAAIAHLVVKIKEELERIREQLQNIE